MPHAGRRVASSTWKRNTATMKTLVLLIVALFAPLIAQAVTRVACIGDSITYGTGLADRATQAYPARLQALLGEDYEVRNFGNPGRGIYLHTRRGNTMRGFRHMPEHRAALAWQPDIVICNLGINDCGAFLKTEDERPGTFRDDYLALLTDYAALPSKPKLYVWGKLAPLAPGQTFYRSPEPFLMQAEIAAAARHANATTIDMETPLLPLLLKHFPDRIHPDAEASEVIAETVAKALLPAAEPPAATVTRPANHTGWATPWPAAPVTIPADIAGRCETWLCAGQSNMFWTLDRCAGADTEAAATAKHDIRLWDFVTGQWRRITPANAKEWSAIAVSFAIRRAEATGKPSSRRGLPAPLRHGGRGRQGQAALSLAPANPHQPQVPRPKRRLPELLGQGRLRRPSGPREQGLACGRAVGFGSGASARASGHRRAVVSGRIQRLDRARRPSGKTAP